MRLTLACAVLAASLLALAARPGPAEACGGCFAPSETVTTVDSHRMAIALSPNRTILWDQIRYSGDPEDFVWVLPVPSEDVTIDVADDLFFAELERQTAVRVQGPNPPPPPSSCPGPNGAAAGVDAGASGAADAGVDVYQEEVVGPYETVVLGSGDAGALVDWLNDHGYAVAEETVPTLQFYADRDNRFVVLRLAPDQGVSAMQPIRVGYPGYMASFPLKMVTIGAYGKLALTLWVVAEQRYEAKNYPTLEIDESELVWDFAAQGSNYRDLFRRAIDEDGGGRGWVAQFARPLDNLFFQSEEATLAREAVPYAYLTRLETDMRTDHLAEDLLLGPAEGAGISNALRATRSVNDPPPPSCPDWDGDGVPDDQEHDHVLFGCAAAGSSGGGALLLAALALFASFRRSRRSRG